MAESMQAPDILCRATGEVCPEKESLRSAMSSVGDVLSTNLGLPREVRPEQDGLKLLKRLCSVDEVAQNVGCTGPIGKAGGDIVCDAMHRAMSRRGKLLSILRITKG